MTAPTTIDEGTAGMLTIETKLAMSQLELRMRKELDTRFGLVLEENAQLWKENARLSSELGYLRGRGTINTTTTRQDEHRQPLLEKDSEVAEMSTTTTTTGPHRPDNATPHHGETTLRHQVPLMTATHPPPNTDDHMQGGMPPQGIEGSSCVRFLIPVWSKVSSFKQVTQVHANLPSSM